MVGGYCHERASLRNLLILARLAGIEPTTLGFNGQSDRDHHRTKDKGPEAEGLDADGIHGAIET